MLIRPLYARHIEQVLVTVGLQLAFVALVTGDLGPGPEDVRRPRVAARDDRHRGRAHPERPLDRDRDRRRRARLLQLFLRRTRYGLIIRAGVENRAMVQALGIDVRKAFTLVFAIGGIAAAIAGVLSGVYFNDVDPEQGTSLLIFAFIVVVIGGLGSIGGSALAAVIVGARPAVHELLRLVGRRRHDRRAAARRSCCSRGRAGSPGVVGARA